MHAERNPSRSLAYVDRKNTKAPGWHALVVADVLLNNLAVGLFLAAAVCDLGAPAAFASVTLWAYPIALALLFADLICLVFDLGDPLRFHHMLRVFKPSSPMSLGTWCLTALSFFLTIIVALDALTYLGWLPSGSFARWWVRQIALIAGLPFGFGSASYKGVLFSTTAQPGWKDVRWLGAYFVNSSIMLGTAEMLLLATLLNDLRAVTALRPAFGLLILLNVITLVLLAFDLSPVVSRLYSQRTLWAVGGILFLIGLVVPLSLLWTGGGVAFTLPAVLSLILASFAIRCALVWLPHLVT